MNALELAKQLLKNLQEKPEGVESITKGSTGKGFEKSMLNEDFTEAFAKAKKAPKKDKPWWKNKGGKKNRSLQERADSVASPEEIAQNKLAHESNKKVLGKEEKCEKCGKSGALCKCMEKAKIFAGPGHQEHKPGTVLANLPSAVTPKTSKVTTQATGGAAAKIHPGNMVRTMNVAAQHDLTPARQPGHSWFRQMFGKQTAKAEDSKIDPARSGKRWGSRPFASKRNPDAKADAKLGEKVENLVEGHMSSHKIAERKEGHKVSFSKEMLKEEYGFGKAEKKPSAFVPKTGKDIVTGKDITIGGKPGSLERQHADKVLANYPKKK